MEESTARDDRSPMGDGEPENRIDIVEETVFILLKQGFSRDEIADILCFDPARAYFSLMGKGKLNKDLTFRYESV